LLVGLGGLECALEGEEAWSRGASSRV
jgi:hypothetical protein